MSEAKAKAASIPKSQVAAAAHELDDEGGPPMTFWEHLDELRKRLTACVVTLVVAAFGAYYVKERLFALLTKPFSDAWRAKGLAGGPTMHFGTPAGSIIAYIKLSMVAGLVFSAPLIFYQLWSFVAPGLYAREKRFVIPFVLLSTLLFAGGGFFAWRAAFPFTFDFFLDTAGTVGGEQGITIQPTVMMDSYIDFALQMILAFGVMFELPLFILFLSLAGIVNYLQLIRFGRWFVLIAFIAAAIFTPPDMTSQVIMAVPMILLYGVSIILAFLFGKKPTEAQREAYRKKKTASR
jgi:sec-independent protein translocase protein TatC